MTEPGIAQVEQRLAIVISESRCKAIGYTVLSVRILNMLTRLKLVQVKDRKLNLTLKGKNFVEEATSIETS